MKSRLYKKIHTNAVIIVVLAGQPLKNSVFSAQPKTLLRALYKYKKAWKHVFNQNHKKFTKGVSSFFL